MKENKRNKKKNANNLSTKEKFQILTKEEAIKVLSLTDDNSHLKNDNKSIKEKPNDNNLLALTNENKQLKDELEKYKIKYENEKEKINKKNKKHILIKNICLLIIKFGFICITIYVLFFLVFGFTRMNKNEMHPTITKGSLVLYYRLDKDYHVGDVVIFNKDNKKYILRIIALENQTVFINEEGEIVNESAYIEKQTLFKDVIPEKSKIEYPYTVEKGKVFVVGDYRLETNDSRMFGSIDIDSIEGKVISFLQTRDI